MNAHFHFGSKQLTVCFLSLQKLDSSFLEIHKWKNTLCNFLCLISFPLCYFEIHPCYCVYQLFVSVIPKLVFRVLICHNLFLHLLMATEEKAREFQKNSYFCFIDYAKAFDCVDHNKLWKIVKEMGIPDHLTCLLRNLYAGQEATVRTGHGTTDWFQIGKGVCQGLLSTGLCRVGHN